MCVLYTLPAFRPSVRPSLAFHQSLRWLGFGNERRCRRHRRRRHRLLVEKLRVLLSMQVEAHLRGQDHILKICISQTD